MKLAQALSMPLLALFLASQAVALAPYSVAQDGALVFTEDEPARSVPTPSAGPAEREPLSFVAHVPGAKDHRAPDWVQPGIRMTVWMGTATVSDHSSMDTVVADPNGDLVDANGKRYRQSTAGGAAGSGGSGSGYIQIDVIHVSSVGVKLDIRNYSGDGTYQAPQVEMVEGSLVNAGSCEHWIHPNLLTQVKTGTNGISSIMKGPWEVGGKTYQAIIFVQKSATSKQSIAYDLLTGVALTQSGMYRSTAQHQRYDPNTGRTGGASTTNKTMMESKFVGLRNLNLPWASEPFSPRASQFETAIYTGQMTMEPNHGVPASLQEDRKRVGRREPGCLGIATKKIFHGMNPAQAPEFPRYTAVHQIGGFLMNPAALAKLRKGQLIDQDPFTKIRTYVEYVGPSSTGNPIVGILEEGAGSSLRWIYDLATGELYGYAVIIPYGPGMTSVSQYNRQWR